MRFLVHMLCLRLCAPQGCDNMFASLAYLRNKEGSHRILVVAVVRFVVSMFATYHARTTQTTDRSLSVPFITILQQTVDHGAIS